MNNSPADITVTILGSGTCVPSLQRSSCSVLVQVKDHLLLFDSGPGTMRRVLEAGTTIFDIEYIFYSHLHPDHTGELVSFLFASKYSGNIRRQNPITLVAAEGFAQFFRGLKAVFGNWIELEPRLFSIIELDKNNEDMLDFDDFSVKSHPVEHTEQSLAYRITGPGGRSVVYSGDTDFSEGLVVLAQDADLLICESAHPDELKVQGHLSPSLAGEIATRAKVGKLVLTHFYPECDQADLEKQCRQTYAGPLILAEDLLKIEL